MAKGSKTHEGYPQVGHAGPRKIGKSIIAPTDNRAGKKGK